jgi:hypothetical protein
MSPSCEATNRSAIQEFPKIFLNPKVLFLVHKNRLLISILSQMNLVCTTPSSVSKIPHAFHMPCPSYPPWLSVTMQRKYVNYAGFCTNVWLYWAVTKSFHVMLAASSKFAFVISYRIHSNSELYLSFSSYSRWYIFGDYKCSWFESIIYS